MAYIPIIILVLLMLTGIPVAFALMISTASYFLFINTGVPVDLIFQRMISGTESFPLLAIPFFITAGCVMNYGGLSSRLMKVADALTGHMRGGLAQVNVVLSLLMGGLSGSANADAAMQCKILVPEMSKRGYEPEFSAAITSASSIITPIVPPGIGLILYAFLAEQSVAQLFFAGYVPGLLLMAALMVVVYFVAKKRNYAPIHEQRASTKTVFIQLGKSFWSLLLPLGILMGLRFGFFTPTEAGAMAVVYAVIVGAFIHRELKPKHIPMIMLESVLSTSTIMLIILSASAFGYYLAWERLPQTISQILINITENKYLFFLIINVFLLMVGMFLEGLASLIILTPLLVPAATAIGIDPVHFGIVMVVNVSIGAITPPFGALAFLTSSILQLKVVKVFREMTWFTISMVLVLFILSYFPAIVMFLPNLLGN